ncbi:unnamed protein product, partial [Staurois parvus]
EKNSENHFFNFFIFRKIKKKNTTSKNSPFLLGSTSDCLLCKKGSFGGYLYYSDILGPQEIRLAVSTSGLINIQIYPIVCEFYNFPSD